MCHAGKHPHICTAGAHRPPDLEFCWFLATSAIDGIASLALRSSVNGVMALAAPLLDTALGAAVVARTRIHRSKGGTYCHV
jgi:hypothetical protein